MAVGLCNVSAENQTTPPSLARGLFVLSLAASLIFFHFRLVAVRAETAEYHLLKNKL